MQDPKDPRQTASDERKAELQRKFNEMLGLDADAVQERKPVTVTKRITIGDPDVPIRMEYLYGGKPTVTEFRELTVKGPLKIQAQTEDDQVVLTIETEAHVTGTFITDGEKGPRTLTV